MRISDWSSDVCSSDLADPGARRAQAGTEARPCAARERDRQPDVASGTPGATAARGRGGPPFRARGCAPPRRRRARQGDRRGKGACRRSEERRVGKSVSVRVDLGGRRIIKKKKRKT